MRPWWGPTACEAVQGNAKDVGGGTGNGHGVLTSSMRRMILTPRRSLDRLNARMRARRLGLTPDRGAWVDAEVLARLRAATLRTKKEARHPVEGSGPV